jgi:hypothetical protein
MRIVVTRISSGFAARRRGANARAAKWGVQPAFSSARCQSAGEPA